MSKFFILSGVLTLFLTACVNKTPPFFNSPDAYLGQTPPSDTPKVFAPGLLADTDIALDRVAFSQDGKEFYYCYNTSWFSTKNLKIKYFKFVDNAWRGPSILNEGFNSPTFSVDGTTLYFPGGDSLGGIVWQSKRTGSGWTRPSLFFRKKYSVYDFMPTSSGNMYIGTNGTWGKADDYSSYDIGVLNVLNNDTVLQNTGSPLNTKNAFDGDFFVAKDESYVIISTKETKDFECELYISFRMPDKTWGNLQSLGPLVNNGIAHRWGQYVTPDNKYLFYTQGTSEKDCHIYWMRFDNLLNKLKQKIH